MTTRREVVGSLALLAGAAAHAPPARAEAGISPRVSLADLALRPADQSPAWVEGQGWFVAEPRTAADPDGVLRLPGPEGHQWRRDEAPGLLRPQWFAQTDDAGDEARAIQRACDFAARYGPFLLDLGARSYACRSRLILDPTRVAMRGAGAVLDFSAMPPPEVRPPVVTLETVWPDKAWSLDGTALVHADGPRNRLTRSLALPEAGRYRVSLVVSDLAGSGHIPFLQVSLTAPGGRRLGGLTAIAPGRYSFEVEGGEPEATLALETDARLRIESLEVEWHGRRECVLIRSTEASPQYGHKWIEGVEFAGPGHGTLLHGLRFETWAEARSSRLDMRNVVIRGFQTGMVFSHRSYLVRGYGLRCLSEIGMHFIGGSQDAGELFSFYGSTFEGSRIALLVQGAEVFLNGTSINFVDQVLVGSGTVTMQGCHLEINRPKQPDRPPFELSRGSVSMTGGAFLITGAEFEKGNQCDVIFHLRSRAASAVMRDVTVYNLRTRSGALADGPGRLDIDRLRGGRPRHIAPLVQVADSRNLLGPLPRDLRTAEGATGAFTRHPLARDSYRAEPGTRFLWLCGRVRSGAEIGAAFEIRGEEPGRVTARIEAVHGESRAAIGNDWSIEVTPGWTAFRASTADTHPAAAIDGRMPEGWETVALMLDLSGCTGAIDLRGIFLCAI